MLSSYTQHKYDIVTRVPPYVVNNQLLINNSITKNSFERLFYLNIKSVQSSTISIPDISRTLDIEENKSIAFQKALCAGILIQTGPYKHYFTHFYQLGVNLLIFKSLLLNFVATKVIYLLFGAIII